MADVVADRPRRLGGRLRRAAGRHAGRRARRRGHRRPHAAGRGRLVRRPKCARTRRTRRRRSATSSTRRTPARGTARGRRALLRVAFERRRACAGSPRSASPTTRPRGGSWSGWDAPRAAHPAGLAAPERTVVGRVRLRAAARGVLSGRWTSRSVRAVARAAAVASWPLSSTEPSSPARSSACCSVSQVSTPKPTPRCGPERRASARRSRRSRRSRCAGCRRG